MEKLISRTNQKRFRNADLFASNRTVSAKGLTAAISDRIPVDSIQCGDAAFLLKQVPAASIDLVITSPPYYMQRAYNSAGMGTGNERSVSDYLDTLLEVFDELTRVVKPSGSIVYNLGDKYLGGSLALVPFRFAIAASQRPKIKLVNNITWVKTNPTPRQFDRRLVSSTEPFFHFVKSSDYYYDRDKFQEHERPPKRHTPSSNLGLKYRHLIANSNLTRQQKTLAHTALDEVISEVHAGTIHSFRMKIKGIHAEAFGGQEGGRKTQMEKNGFTIIRISGRTMKKDVITTPVESIPGIGHSAVFPLDIIREFVKMLCPLGGIVADPYMGSGTTAVAALEEGRHYMGMEIDPSYCEMARERIAQC